MLVDGAQRSYRRLAFSRLVSTDQDAVRLFQVFDCRPLCQELWVGQNLKPQGEIFFFKDACDRFCRRGLDQRTCKLRLGLVLASKILRMLSAARTGTVLFSVTIL